MKPIQIDNINQIKERDLVILNDHTLEKLEMTIEEYAISLEASKIYYMEENFRDGRRTGQFRRYWIARK